MTEESKQNIDFLITRFKDILIVLATVLGIATVAWGAVTWITGGLRPQNEIIAQSLSDKVNALQVGLDNINAKLSVMPRSTDYQAIETHLINIDTALASMDNRLKNDEIDNAVLSERLNEVLGESRHSNRRRISPTEGPSGP